MITEQNVELLNRINFRSCLNAMARPGTVFPIEPFFHSAMMALASVLLYPEVRFFQQADGDWTMIKAMTGTTEVKESEADYLFLDQPDPDILTASQHGDQQNPERSATLVCSCDSFANGNPVLLKGPGIQGSKRTTLPVPPVFLQRLAEKNKDFPLGIDLFFLSLDNTVCALPRTTSVELL